MREHRASEPGTKGHRRPSAFFLGFGTWVIWAGREGAPVKPTLARNRAERVNGRQGRCRWGKLRIRVRIQVFSSSASQSRGMGMTTRAWGGGGVGVRGLGGDGGVLEHWMVSGAHLFSSSLQQKKYPSSKSIRPASIISTGNVIPALKVPPQPGGPPIETVHFQ